MVASASPANVAGVSIKWWSLQNKLSARSSENERARLFLTEPKKLSVVVVVTVAVLQRCQWGRSFVTLTHRCVCLSLPVCVCDGMQATICRALQNDLPTPKRSAQTFTNTRTRSLTYTHAHIRKQPECTGKNCGKLHEITKQRSHWAFRSHILLAVAAATVVVFIACLLLSPPERSTIVFMSLLFNCTHFRFRFRQELRCLLFPSVLYSDTASTHTLVVLFCCCCCDDQLPSNHAPPTQTAETKR